MAFCCMCGSHEKFLDRNRTQFYFPWPNLCVAFKHMKANNKDLNTHLSQNILPKILIRLHRCLVLFYSILFYSILFYSFLFCSPKRVDSVLCSAWSDDRFECSSLETLYHLGYMIYWLHKNTLMFGQPSNPFKCSSYFHEFTYGN